jgi:hypothetical protein
LASLKYDLTGLTWQQFELLAFKCLQIDVSPSIQFIEGGNDKGRDFLFKGLTNFFGTSLGEREYLFQAKHKSSQESYSALLSDLKAEIEKVYLRNQLRYDFYCLVTNLTISGDQFDELNKIFADFFTENQIQIDIKLGIYSYRHLESVIDKNDSLKWNFPSIVSQADFKLLLKEILNGSSIDIRNGWLAVFEKNKPKFVYTNIYGEALSKLEKENIILLSGPPKSGKTFTAEMIIFNSICSEQFEPFKIDQIEDFDKFYNKSTKQIFLFDDVFGKHDIDIYRADSLNRKFEYIFELIDDNHKCLFTSREYIVRAFSDYSDSDLNKLISKIVVETNNLTAGEKESLFRRYFYLRFADEFSLTDYSIDRVIKHQNFSPETIRSYFDDCTQFKFEELLQHLSLPDKYLEKVFMNLSETRRVTLLSLLFSLHDDEFTIAYAYKNVCIDLNKTYLLNLKNELNLLEGSLVKFLNGRYSFYHPSMFDFFVKYLGTDIAIYRSILLRNLNLNLLSLLKFAKTNKPHKIISIEKIDLTDLKVGFQRMINNPSVLMFELNSILFWFLHPDTQLFFKAKHKGESVDFNKVIFAAIKNLQIDKYKNEEPSSLADFFDLVRLSGKTDSFSSNKILEILHARKTDNYFWLIAFKIIPFLSKEVVLDESNLGKNWLNQFYKDLKKEIDDLGKELYGDAYPKFEKLEEFKRLMSEKKIEEANALKVRQKADFKQNTNSQWYPRFKVCKEKMMTLKSSHPLGYKIYELLIENFSQLTILEENQKNRYLFNRKKKWWN